MATKFWRRWAKSLLLRIAPTLRARALPGVEGLVHENDVMLYDTTEESIHNYLQVAESALANISNALEKGQKSFAEIDAVLDFGCGHGRVLRRLRQEIPAGKITACDVDEEGVQFCAAEFGAKPLVSSWNVADIRLETYDLVWSGSVFTHLDGAEAVTLFSLLGQSLRPGGVLVFTFHGDFSLDGLDHLYGGIYAGSAAEIRHEVATQSFSFRVYDQSFGDFPGKYGMAWHSREYWRDQARSLSEKESFGDGQLRLIYWQPQGWDHHHDVVAFQRVEKP